MGEALGLLEVRGLASSIAVTDAMMKAADTLLIDVKESQYGKHHRCSKTGDTSNMLCGSRSCAHRYWFSSM